MLLFLAYKLEPYQVIEPNWIASRLYDVAAKVPAAATRDEMRLMLRSLLAERFHLALRRETRDTSIYSLVKVKSDPIHGCNQLW
jgi:uncharacterized protein (TIGR03435 family)